MLAITDLSAEFAKLQMWRGRTSHTTAAEREESGSFARVMPYRDGAIFITKFAGTGHWERHPRAMRSSRSLMGRPHSMSSATGARRLLT